MPNRTTEPIVKSLTEPCSACGGEGKVPTRHGYTTCGTCNGSGAASPSRSSFSRGDVSAREDEGLVEPD